MRNTLVLAAIFGISSIGSSQNVPFTSGPIPLCDTSTFTANVWGVGYLVPPGTWGGSTLYSLLINITSDHPQTLQILLTSPEGTTLSLSEFNGGGGANYTGTNFIYDPWPAPSITTGSAPFTGNWTPQGGSFSIFDNEYADGTWTITVIDTACANGGIGPGGTWTPGWFDGSDAAGGFSFAFNSPPPPDCWGSIPSETTTICNGESVDILGYYESLGFGYTYVITPWSGQAMPDPNAVTEAGTYWIDAWDLNSWANCTYYATFEIVVSGTSLGPDQMIDQCNNAPTDLSALFTTGSITPSWTLNGVPISGTAVTAAITPGIYQLTDASAACGDTAIVTLNMGTLDVGADQLLSICSGASADLAALYDMTGYTAEWLFQGSVIALPDAAIDPGIYTLIGTSAEGCIDSAQVTLAVAAAPSLGADVNVSFCSNTTYDLTSLFNTTGLDEAWSYLGIPVTDPSAIIAGGPYLLIASAGGDCSDTAMVFVIAEPPPVLGTDLLATTCEGEGEDIASYFTTTGLVTEWSFGGAPVIDPTAVMAAGTYTLIATNSAGCSDTGLVDLEVVADPVLGPDQSIVICEGLAIDLTALFPIGPNSASWSLNGAPIGDPGSVTEAGTYLLIATNAAGCSSTASVTVALEPSPEIGADLSISICEGNAIDLPSFHDTSGLTTNWSLSGAPVTDPASVDVAGSYRLIVENAAGCTDTAFVQLAIDPGPSLGSDQSFLLCPWQTVDLVSAFSTGSMNAAYTVNDQPVADPTLVTDAGTYMILATNGAGCSDTAFATVIAIECLCVADFTENARCMQDPVKFTLLADSAIVSAVWDLHGAAGNSTEIDPEIRFNAEGDVRVSLRATLTCGVIDLERTIRIEDCSDSCSVWIPSTFTPNGDGINEGWTWKGECDPKDFSMQIYDRFGEMIFTSTDPHVMWDGTVKGEGSPIGVYAYRVGYRLPYQDRREVVGSITLLR